MTIDSLLQFLIALPRGGARIVALLSRWIPRLRQWPIQIPFAPDLYIQADLRESIFFPLLKYGCYPHQVVEDFILCTLLKKEDVVLDVGANIGYVSAVCANAVGKQGKVFAFEPSRITRPYLMQLSGQLPQLTVISSAVSDTNGTVYFVDEKSLDLSHIDPANGKAPQAYAVASVTLDQWASTHAVSKLNLVKIDTEGFDVEVIQGARQLISRFHPVIQFEAFSKDPIQKIADILNLELKADYRIYRILNPFPFSLITKIPDTNNYIAFPNHKMDTLPKFLLDQHFLTPIE